MKRYRIRRGTDQAWLASAAPVEATRFFWTDLEECALQFQTSAQAELISGALHLFHTRRDRLVDGPGVAVVEETPK